jgi:hypothetical protein
LLQGEIFAFPSLDATIEISGDALYSHPRQADACL